MPVCLCGNVFITFYCDFHIFTLYTTYPTYIVGLSTFTFSLQTSQIIRMDYNETITVNYAICHYKY